MRVALRPTSVWKSGTGRGAGLYPYRPAPGGPGRISPFPGSGGHSYHHRLLRAVAAITHSHEKSSIPAKCVGQVKMTEAQPVSSRCDGCGTSYRVIEIELPPTPDEPEISCLNCGAPLMARKAGLALKYFLTGPRRPARRSRPVAVPTDL